jgi:hypothetical protein
LFSSLAFFSLFLAACTSGGPRPAPAIDRLPAETAQESTAPLDRDRLLAMVRAGDSPEALVERWRRDGARLKLGASDIVYLHGRGVPLSLLDTLLDAREQALRADLDTRLATRQTEFSRQLAAEQARVPVCPAPYYGGFSPYGGWGSGSGWWGGIHRAW